MTNYDEVTDLTNKIQLLEKDVLAHLGENAHLKMRNAELQVEVSTLRGYADRVECHLRDAKANIVLLMSKIQECEARRY
jgi:hypothetical protein